MIIVSIVSLVHFVVYDLLLSHKKNFATGVKFSHNIAILRVPCHYIRQMQRSLICNTQILVYKTSRKGESSCWTVV